MSAGFGAGTRRWCVLVLALLAGSCASSKEESRKDGTGVAAPQPGEAPAPGYLAADDLFSLDVRGAFGPNLITQVRTSPTTVTCFVRSARGENDLTHTVAVSEQELATLRELAGKSHPETAVSVPRGARIMDVGTTTLAVRTGTETTTVAVDGSNSIKPEQNDLILALSALEQRCQKDAAGPEAANTPEGNPQ